MQTLGGTVQVFVRAKICPADPCKRGLNSFTFFSHHLLMKSRYREMCTSDIRNTTLSLEYSQSKLPCTLFSLSNCSKTRRTGNHGRSQEWQLKVSLNAQSHGGSALLVSIAANNFTDESWESIALQSSCGRTLDA